MTGGSAKHFWWCLDHGQVEPDEGCANSVRLGPFDDYAAAENALELARQRTEAWDNDDETWGGKEAGPPDRRP